MEDGCRLVTAAAMRYECQRKDDGASKKTEAQYTGSFAARTSMKKEARLLRSLARCGRCDWGGGSQGGVGGSGRAYSVASAGMELAKRAVCRGKDARRLRTWWWRANSMPRLRHR